MTHTIGNIDRIIRVVLGLAFLMLIFIGPETWFGLVGIIPLIMGLIGLCPVRRQLGTKTRPLHR